MNDYVVYTKQLRHTIITELKNNSYNFLINPNTRKKNDMLLGLPVYRPSMMARGEFLPGKGNSLNIGSNEIILALHGALNKSNPNSFNPYDRFRFVLGDDLNNTYIRMNLQNEFQIVKPLFMDQIIGGEIPAAVKLFLQTVNSVIASNYLSSNIF